MGTGRNRSSVSIRYIMGVGVSSFFLAAVLFSVSNILSRYLDSIFLSFSFLVLVITLGLAADIVGTAVAAADEVPFHARAAKKVMGAAHGVYLIRNADRVANICNDFIGDIAGTLSGALGIALVVQIGASYGNLDRFTLNMVMTGLIAMCTVGGKAAGKKIALSRPNDVIFFVGRMMAYFEKLSGIKLVGRRKR